MTGADTRRALLIGLLLFAAGGLLLHFRIHPFLLPDKDHPGVTIFRGPFVAATLLPLIDVVVVTALFATRRTAPLGYLVNGILVIYGTVLMGHFAIAGLAPKDPPLLDWVLKSTFPDIVIAWGDFFVGQALYQSWMRET